MKRVKQTRPPAGLIVKPPDPPDPPGPTIESLADAAVAFMNERMAEAATAISKIGRYLIDDVFHGDALVALDDPASNPLYVEIRSRTSSPRCEIDRPTLSLALRIGAWDKLIEFEAWQKLTLSRKRILLPLADEDRLRKGALHAMRMNLDEIALAAYVDVELAKTTNRRRKSRKASVPGLRRATHALAALESEESRDAVVERVERMPVEDRDEFVDSFEKSLQAARRLLAKLKKLKKS